jgi:RNA polymerase sigma factor (sigma-70 family)
MTAEDSDLLQRFVAHRDEAAFAELVRRYLNLVYFAALRQVGGDAHRAEDVAQNVFTLLARKAESLTRHQTLAGWLHTTARFAASEALRTERRRLAREQEAHTMRALSNDPAAQAEWERLRPIIDEALNELGDADREAVLLRFFADQPLAAIGAKLHVSENAARMRVDRALQKLHALLAQRGVTSTAAALAAVLANQAAAVAPAGLAASVTSAALALAGTAGGGATAMAFMSASKIIAGLAGLVAAAAAVGLVLQYRANTQLRERLEFQDRQGAELARMRVENERLANAQAAQNDELDRLRAALAARSDANPPGSGAGSMIRGTATAPGDASTAAGPGFIVQGATLEGRYAALFKELGLDAGRLDKFKNLLAAKRQAAEDAMDALLKQGVNPNQNMEATRGAVAAAQASVNAQIKEELGDDGYAHYQRYEATLPQRNTIEQLGQLLSPTIAPLTGEQFDRMVTLLEKSHEPEGKGGPGRLMDGNLNYHSKISAQTIAMAADVLTPPQVEMLQHLQNLQRGGGK